MGFLSFRKKSKKALTKATLTQLETVNLTNENDNDSGVYSICHSPIEDLSQRVTGSFMSDLTQSGFSNEIFNELPAQKSDTSYNSSSSGSETSSYKGIIRNSLSLKSSGSCSPSATEPIANLPLPGEALTLWTTENQPDCRIKDSKADSTASTSSDLSSGATAISTTFMPSKSTTLQTTFLQLHGFPQSHDGIGISKSELPVLMKSDPSVVSLSMATEFSPFSHNTGPNSRSSNHVAQSQAATEGLASKSPQFQELTINKNDGVIPMASVSTSSSKSSPVLAIDRMKERHRQECRRPIHWTSAAAEVQLATSRKFNLFGDNNNDATKIPSLQRQQQYVHNQPATLPPLISKRMPNAKMVPGRSMSVMNAPRTKMQLYAPPFVSDPILVLNPISENNPLDNPVAGTYLKSAGIKSNLRPKSHRNYLPQLDSTTLDAKPEHRPNCSAHFPCVQAVDCYTFRPSWIGHVTQTHSHFDYACKHTNAKLACQHTNYPVDISNYSSETHRSTPLHNQRKNPKLTPGNRHEPQCCKRRLASVISFKSTDECIHNGEQFDRQRVEKPMPEMLANCRKPAQSCSHHRLHQSMIERSYCQSRQYCSHASPKCKHCCCYSDYCNEKNRLQAETVPLAHGSPSKKYGTTSCCKKNPNNIHSCKARDSDNTR